MRQLVEVIQTLWSGISHNFFIQVDGEGAITYEVVQDYMASKMNADYVEKDSAEEHLRVIRST